MQGAYFEGASHQGSVNAHTIRAKNSNLISSKWYKQKTKQIEKTDYTETLYL